MGWKWSIIYKSIAWNCCRNSICLMFQYGYILKYILCVVRVSLFLKWKKMELVRLLCLAADGIFHFYAFLKSLSRKTWDFAEAIREFIHSEQICTIMTSVCNAEAIKFMTLFFSALMRHCQARCIFANVLTDNDFKKYWSTAASTNGHNTNYLCRI